MNKEQLGNQKTGIELIAEEQATKQIVNTAYIGVCSICKKETEVWDYLDSSTCKTCFDEFKEWQQSRGLM